mmetsp:Transcript_16596/g.29048  ORF Transcript_16596/g.29048 Transcript_16596/m.29048 type:complete len:481 (-) Transcript_16596:159-1601(-)
MALDRRNFVSCLLRADQSGTGRLSKSFFEKLFLELGEPAALAAEFAAVISQVAGTDGDVNCITLAAWLFPEAKEDEAAVPDEGEGKGNEGEVGKAEDQIDDKAEGKGGKAKGKGKAPPPPRKGPSKEELRRRQAEKVQQEKEELRRRTEEEDASHWQSLKACDVQSRLPWKAMQKTLEVKGSSGTGGVVLVQLESRAVVLKKGQGEFASQLFADNLAAALRVPVARTRVISVNEDEFWELSEMLLELVIDKNPSQEELLREQFKEAFQAKQRGESPSVLGSRHHLAMEFVAGAPFTGVKAQELLSSPRPELLLGLGRLAALDALLNNLDRVPLPIWDKSGNFTNIMVRDDVPVGIDNLVWAISSELGLAKYKARLKELAAASPTTNAALAQVLRAVVYEECLVELSDTSVQYVAEGLKAGFEAAADLWLRGDLQKRLQQWQLEVEDRFGTPADPGAVSPAKVADFLRVAMWEVSHASGVS